jgi:hypothetical protein
MRQICVQRRDATMCARGEPTGVKIPPRALKRGAGNWLLIIVLDAPAMPIFGFKNLAGTSFQLLRLQQLVLRVYLFVQSKGNKTFQRRSNTNAFNLKLLVLKVICLRKDLCQLIFQRLRL